MHDDKLNELKEVALGLGVLLFAGLAMFAPIYGAYKVFTWATYSPPEVRQTTNPFAAGGKFYNPASQPSTLSNEDQIDIGIYQTLRDQGYSHSDAVSGVINSEAK